MQTLPFLSSGGTLQILQRSGPVIKRFAIPYASVFRERPDRGEISMHSIRFLPLYPCS